MIKYFILKTGEWYNHVEFVRWTGMNSQLAVDYLYKGNLCISK